jgi:hypothetical protein
MPKWYRDSNTGEYGCDQEQRNILIDAFDDFITFSCLSCYTGLRSNLQNVWVDVVLNCCENVGYEAMHRNGYIVMCIFEDPKRIAPVLLHELVHAVDGNELDAEAIEYWCFLENGAKAPKGDDWDEFKEQSIESVTINNETEFTGTYVIWNSDTGEIWGKKADGSKKEPPCFQSDDWKHDYSDSGWG